uniref:Uncharacterized protein n=1 Tax=Oryza nivara TaxID=4536 RepID=A0A0E0HUJ0_ORYNI
MPTRLHARPASPSAAAASSAREINAGPVSPATSPPTPPPHPAWPGSNNQRTRLAGPPAHPRPPTGSLADSDDDIAFAAFTVWAPHVGATGGHARLRWIRVSLASLSH